MARKSAVQSALEKAAGRVIALERAAAERSLRIAALEIDVGERNHRIFDLEKRIAERDDRDAKRAILKLAEQWDGELRMFCEEVERPGVPADAVFICASSNRGEDVLVKTIPARTLRRVAHLIREGAVLREFHPKLRTAAFPGARQT